MSAERKREREKRTMSSNFEGNKEGFTAIL
jgi:hypothetical protein